jgi:uncharacterized membrane protein
LFIVLYGALFGYAIFCLAPLGKGYRLVIGMLVFMVIVGIVLLSVGMTALLLVGQPSHIWYGLILCGALLLVVFPFISLAVRKQYARAEQRRMQALDA